MKAVNLVFGEDYNDVDILLVPDEIADNIDVVLRKFNKWLSIPENQNRFLVPYHGRMVLGIDTKEFLWWLNNCEMLDNQESTILKQHTAYQPDYPAAFL